MGPDWNLDGKHDWQDEELFFYLIANKSNSDKIDAPSGKGREYVPSETQTSNGEQNQIAVAIAAFLVILIFLAILTGNWGFVPILIVCFIVVARFI